MNFLRDVFRFYISSSIHVALAVLAFFFITALEYNFKPPITTSAFIFLGTISAYNFVKYASIAGLHHRSLTNSLRAIQVFSAICFLLWIFLAFHLSFTTLLFVALFGVTTVLYAVPIIQHRSLRMFSGLKIFVVAFVWAGITVIIPFIASELAITTDVILTFIQRFLIVVVLILPFEIRDIPYDALALKTIPQQIGIKNTKNAGLAALAFSLFIEFFKKTSEVAYITSLLLFSIILGLAVFISKKDQKRYFSSFLVEGLPILWFVMYVTFKTI
ncbi:hypothetical protein [Aequorivita xiaoshiensis]|uniref:Prenyltransferase n=1 Tax=Aequorivita xiaoshiensis TaxID=2874476 RepID=A0A9X1U4W8_9FLAO|nr:hypothetical protein [Aequorivita xiaoshiensis]MCG2429567.1 hypothetical protein [Aequorivita xiaoshiensis]